MGFLKELVRYLYSILVIVALPIIFLRLFYRGRKNPEYRKRLLERLGLFPAPPKTGGLWLHAVSVGESIAAVSILRAFQKHCPDTPITVTTTTPTGSKIIQTQLGNSVFHVYFPYDVPMILNAFLKRIQPHVLVIMETELWPNCLHQCQKNKIPVIIANAQISLKSMTRYYSIRWFMEDKIKSLACVAAQSSVEGERFIALGLPESRLKVIGNVKYDFVLPEGIERKGLLLREQWGAQRPVFIAASTHAGEEEKIIEAFQYARKFCSDLVLILVPRHKERFLEIETRIKQTGFSYVTRSSGETPSLSTDIYLGDTLGELMLFYAAAEIAFVGGSFVPIGGHNTLEPAALGIPCLVGPNVQNFLEITQVLKEAGALELVQDSQALADRVVYWLKHPDKRAMAGESGKKTVANNRGAIETLLNIIKPYLKLEEQQEQPLEQQRAVSISDIPRSVNINR